jgi:NAD(P)-dependent dehydrogenase (short-subunit alcohol dehydrogenase family)
MSIFSIKNKIIIVTGVSKGIGRYLADNLVVYGAKVYGISRKKIINTKFLNIVCDINDQKKIRKEIKKIFFKEKKICCLINNAGITKPSKNLTNNLKSFDEVINTNTKAPLLLANECYKYMSKNKIGSIINICSLASKLGFPNNPVYVASKGGLAQASKALAIDFAHKNIRVNNILPGYIKTSMTIKSYKNKKNFNIRKNRTMFKKWGEPADILGSVIFLSSDASKYITGIDLNVDGGWLSNGL